MSQTVINQIVDLLENLEKMGVNMPLAISKGRAFMPHELVIYASNLSDNDIFWADVPEKGQHLRAELHGLILKHNQPIL